MIRTILKAILIFSIVLTISIVIFNMVADSFVGEPMLLKIGIAIVVFPLILYFFLSNIQKKIGTKMNYLFSVSTTLFLCMLSTCLAIMALNLSYGISPIETFFIHNYIFPMLPTPVVCFLISFLFRGHSNKISTYDDNVLDSNFDNQ